MHGTLTQLSTKAGTRVLFQNVIGEAIGDPVILGRRRHRLSGIVARHAHRSRAFVVSIHKPGDTLRPRDYTVRLRKSWSKTLVGPNDVVLVTYLPLGGGGAGASTGKQIGAAIALVALAVAAPYAVGLAGAAGAGFLGTVGALSFAGHAVAAGIVIGGGYLISRALQAKANKEADNRPLYGVSGGGNLPRPGDRIPCLYGHTWSQPDLSQADYTVYDGEDQILYKRMTLGLGKYQIHKIMIGTVPMWNEDDGILAPFNTVPGGDAVGEIGDSDTNSGLGTEVELIAPGDLSTLVPGSVYSAPSVSGQQIPYADDIPATAGPFAANPVGTLTSRIQIDYSFPSGWYWVNKHGSYQSFPVDVLFEYAPCDDDDLPTAGWSTLYHHTGDILATRAQRFTRRIDVTEGRYIVRAKLGAGYDEPPTNLTVNFPVYAATWDGLRSYFDDSIVRPHVTEIAMRIRSGKGLGITAFADVWVEATRKLNTWNGSAWVEAATRKAVYALKDVLQSEYGGNLGNNEVDLERVKSYASSLTEFDTFDGVIRGPVSVFEAASTVLGPIRGEPTRIGNTWSINRDEERSVRKHVFSRRQIARGSTTSEFKIARDDGASDVVVEYSLNGDPRVRRDVRVTFGAETLTPRRVQPVGITEHEHAYHFATWMAASAYYRRERRKFSVDRQGRIVGRGDPVIADSWFMSDARSAGVLSVSGNVLTLDTDIPTGGTPYAMLRNRSGEEWGPVAVTVNSGNHKIITLNSSDVSAIEAFFGQSLSGVFSAGNEDATTVLVGPLTELQDKWLIDSVQPQGRNTVAIEAVFDAPEVWTALGEPIPSAPDLPSLYDLKEVPLPTVTWVKAHCIQKGVALEMEWAVGHARGASSYVVQASYDDGSTWETVSEGLSTSGTWALKDVAVDVRVGAYALSIDGLPGPAVYTTFATFRPVIDGDLADVEIAIDQLNADLTARLKQIESQIPNLIDRIRREIDTVSAAANAQMAVAQEMLGRLRQGVGVRHQENYALITQTQTTVSNLEGSFADFVTTVQTGYYTKNETLGEIEANATVVIDGLTYTNAAGAFAAYTTHIESNFYTKTETDNEITSNATVVIDSITYTTAAGAFGAFSAHITSNFYTKGETDNAIASNATVVIDAVTYTTAASAFAAYDTHITSNFYTKSGTDAAIEANATVVIGGVTYTDAASAFGAYELHITSNYDTKGDVNQKISNAAQVTIGTATYADATEAFAANNSNLNASINSKAHIFAQNTTPTATNVGDLWFDTSINNRPSRWNGTTWVIVADYNQNHIYAQPFTPVANGIGDLWVDTSDNNRLYRWDGNAWVEVTDPRISANASAIQTLITDVVGSGETASALAAFITDLHTTLTVRNRIFAQNTTPTASNVGDLWFDTTVNNRPSRWNGTTWEVVQDLNHNHVYAQYSAPTAQAVGDLWIDDDKKLHRWDGNAWVDVTDIRTEASANAIQSLITNVVGSSGNITALASFITDLDAAVGDVSASGSFHVQAIVSSDGSALGAIQFGTSAGTPGGQVATASFEMASYSDGVGGYFSRNIFRADRTLIQVPSVNGGAPITAFDVATINGTPRVTMPNVYIENLRAGTVTYDNLVSGAATTYARDSFAAEASEVAIGTGRQITSISITPKGTVAQIIFSCPLLVFRGTGGGNGVGCGRVQVKRGSTVVKNYWCYTRGSSANIDFSDNSERFAEPFTFTLEVTGLTADAANTISVFVLSGAVNDGNPLNKSSITHSLLPLGAEMYGQELRR